MEDILILLHCYLLIYPTSLYPYMDNKYYIHTRRYGDYSHKLQKFTDTRAAYPDYTSRDIYKHEHTVFPGKAFIVCRVHDDQRGPAWGDDRLRDTYDGQIHGLQEKEGQAPVRAIGRSSCGPFHICVRFDTRGLRRMPILLFRQRGRQGNRNPYRPGRAAVRRDSAVRPPQNACYVR